LYTLEQAASGACVGWASPGVELQIRAGDDPAQAEDAGDNADADGEVWLRARHMCEGMLDESGFVPHPDGWHRTGDLGRIDARGRLWLTGRVADVIKTGGYRVNPDEIEACLSGMRSCERVCVTSLPSEYWGEVIVAVAEGADTHTDTTGDWVAEAAMRLAALSRHKHPRAYVSFDLLPRNPQGKISRRSLRDLIAATHAYNDGPYPTLTARPARSADIAPQQTAES
jgi:O-succinylbenzoic acid--CoA ligase